MSKIVINKGVIVKKSKGGLTIFDPEESIMYSLNETASFIFTLLKKQFMKDEIVSKMTERYDVTREVAEKDFDEIAKDFKNKKIIQ